MQTDFKFNGADIDDMLMYRLKTSGLSSHSYRSEAPVRRNYKLNIGSPLTIPFR